MAQPVFRVVSYHQKWRRHFKHRGFMKCPNCQTKGYVHQAYHPATLLLPGAGNWCQLCGCKW